MDWLGTKKAFILAIRKGGTPGKGGRPAHDLREIRIEYMPELLEDIYGRWTLASGSESPPCEHKEGAQCSLKENCSYAPISN